MTDTVCLSARGSGAAGGARAGVIHPQPGWHAGRAALASTAFLQTKSDTCG